MSRSAASAARLCCKSRTTEPDGRNYSRREPLGRAAVGRAGDEGGEVGLGRPWKSSVSRVRCARDVRGPRAPDIMGLRCIGSSSPSKDPAGRSPTKWSFRSLPTRASRSRPRSERASSLMRSYFLVPTTAQSSAACPSREATCADCYPAPRPLRPAGLYGSAGRNGHRGTGRAGITRGVTPLLPVFRSVSRNGA